MSLFLAQVIGIAFVIFGVAMTVRHKEWTRAVHQFSDSRVLRFLVGSIEVVLGTLLILSHSVWVLGFEALVSLVGWLLLLEGLFFLFASDKAARKALSFFNRTEWYIGCGLALFIIGLFLAAVGFGFV